MIHFAAIYAIIGLGFGAFIRLAIAIDEDEWRQDIEADDGFFISPEFYATACGLLWFLTLPAFLFGAARDKWNGEDWGDASIGYDLDK